MEKYTNQTFFYKQTPVNYDGIAKFTSIKGNTLGWNQQLLAPTTSGATTSSADGSFRSNRCTFTYDSATHIITITSLENVGTSGFVFGLANGAPLIVGHKYLQMCDVQAPKVFNFVIGTNDNADAKTNLPANTYHRVSTIKEFSSSSNEIRFNFNNSNGWAGTETVYIKNAMLFDLTQMVLDISSPSEFPFSLPYYDYNQGTLIPFSGNGIKTVGKNRLKMPSSATLNGISFNVDAVGQIQITGTATAQTDFYLYGASGRYDDIGIMSSTYTFSCRKDSTTTGLNFFLVSQQLGTRIGVQLDTTSLSQTVALDGSDKYRVFIRVTNGTTINTKVALQLELGASVTDYEPYTSSTLSLPISTYFPTGMKSAGNVYDELTESKAITRIGAVEMSSLSWTMPTSGVFQVYKSDAHVQPKVLSAFFKYFTNNFTYGGAPNYEDGTGGVNPNNQNIYYKDSNFTSVDALKSALSGKYLYYELATPIETDAEDIFYKFYADGTEQLLPVNGSTPTTSYLIADIEYYDSTEGDSLYRRFWLINGDGERWDLTDKEFKSFLNNPTGLGFRKTIEITRYGEKANKNNEVYDFPQPSGELLFYDTYNSTRYDKYNKFIRFLMSQPITLYYMIPVSYISGIANIFTLNCDVTEVQKTESKTDHILTSSIVFNGLGFYEGDEISINGTTDTYTLANEGDFPVGFEITVEGSLTKPYITLSQDGELYGEAKFDSETAFNSLYLNSNDGEQNIILQQGGSVIPNPLSYQDLSISNGSIYVTFVKLAKGVSELSIGMESGSITNVNIKYSPKYRSV